jgi:hypothetical protein
MMADGSVIGWELPDKACLSDDWRVKRAHHDSQDVIVFGGNFEGLMGYGCDLSQSGYDWLGRSKHQPQNQRRE